jgi:hypothetical protein
VVVQVTVFLLDDNLKVVSRACGLPFDERFDEVFLQKKKKRNVRFPVQFLRFFCGQEQCVLLFAVNISFLLF